MNNKQELEILSNGEVSLTEIVGNELIKKRMGKDGEFNLNLDKTSKNCNLFKEKMDGKINLEDLLKNKNKSKYSNNENERFTNVVKKLDNVLKNLNSKKFINKKPNLEIKTNKNSKENIKSLENSKSDYINNNNYSNSGKKN